LLAERPGAEAVYAADDYARLAGALRAAGVSEEDLRAYREAWSQAGWLSAALNYYRANRFRAPGPDGSPANGNYAPHLGGLTVRAPTRVMWGERDVSLPPPTLEGLERYVPDLTIKRVPDAGHWVTHERPGLVTASIREFTA